jgi:hypothetical protein
MYHLRLFQLVIGSIVPRVCTPVSPHANEYSGARGSAIKPRSAITAHPLLAAIT